MAVRTLLVVAGVLAFVGGLIATAAGEVVEGLWAMLVGGVLIVGGALERRRYRSADAERGGDPTGPGGGEPAGEPIEGRFEPTAEAFVDPTTGHRMRVLVDRRTGERRYRAEG